MDCLDFVKKCNSCQIHGNLIHAPVVDLRTTATPWPFHTWGMDLIGPLSRNSRGNMWIIISIKMYTKWVETIPIRKASGAIMAKFIKEHIIYRFGVPQVILSDNWTPFVNRDVKGLLGRYHVKHFKSSPLLSKGKWISRSNKQYVNQDLVQDLGWSPKGLGRTIDNSLMGVSHFKMKDHGWNSICFSI